MNPRNSITAAIALAAALIIPSASDAGIFRDVLSSVGIGQKDPPKDANGIPSFPRMGFACCDLHYNKSGINDYNYSELPMIPAGTPVEVIRYGRHSADLKVDGKAVTLDQDYGRDQESLDVFVKKLIINDDPRPRIASYPVTVQEAIRQGKVMVGMTREQCIVAIGYPIITENLTLDAPSWTLYHASGEAYRLYFGPDGHLQKISADGDLAKVAYSPGS
jgi:hypothetical protein